jgi:hypothetical protein
VYSFSSMITPNVSIFKNTKNFTNYRKKCHDTVFLYFLDY